MSSNAINWRARPSSLDQLEEDDQPLLNVPMKQTSSLATRCIKWKWIVAGFVFVAITGFIWGGARLFVYAIGFRSEGIVKGSIAAWIMSSAKKRGCCKSIVSFLQSAGAKGFSPGTSIVLIIIGMAIATGVLVAFVFCRRRRRAHIESYAVHEESPDRENDHISTSQNRPDDDDDKDDGGHDNTRDEPEGLAGTQVSSIDTTAAGIDSISHETPPKKIVTCDTPPPSKDRPSISSSDYGSLPSTNSTSVHE